MTTPLSNDLRERVVLAIREDASCRAAAARFGVCVSSAVKWSQRFRATGAVAPSRIGNCRKPMLDAHRDFIVERINQTSHLTLYGACCVIPAFAFILGTSRIHMKNIPESKLERL